jgi:diguanylate cyclase (GGDEF)-like protein/PAS domain S-box-containing protein
MLDKIIRHSPIGIAVIDREGLYRRVNPAYCGMYGYKPHELIGHSFLHVFPEARRDAMLARHQAFLDGDGEGDMKSELQVLRRDGGLLDIISDSVRFPDDAGRLCRLVYVVDISERKAAEQALELTQQTLRNNEALLLDLAASIPGAVFRLVNQGDLGWRYTYISPGVRDLYEVTPEQVSADRKTLWTKILPEDRPAHDLSIQLAIAGQTHWEHEYRIRTPSGQVKWIHAKARPKRVADGSVVWTGMLTDVSDRKRMEAGLMASEETYRTLFETVPQGIVYHDADGRIISANPAAQRILGLTLDQMQGRTSIDERWHAVREDGSAYPGDQHPAMVALRTGRPVKDVVMGVCLPDRSRAWIQVNATPLFKQGRLSQVYASFEDITRRVQLSHELQHQASTDYLTGVANRRSLMQRVHSEFERSMRHPTVHCCVLAIDLDEFKQINDTWGHATGDAVLIHVARLMREATRQHDVVGRSGGEEFTLLLPDTDIDEAQALAERLRQRIADTPTRHDGHAVPITVSIGIATIRRSDPDADAVLARADRALYQAKHQGRNLVRLAQSA